MLKRCDWCGDNPRYIAYHDEEWGIPQYDSQVIFEFLCLEGMQAGLSWITILNKRDALRAAFADFDPARLVHFNEKTVDRLATNPDIIRHRKKIMAVIHNAKQFLALAEREDVVTFFWQFVDGQAIQNRWRQLQDVPASTATSVTMAKALKQAGFQFVGPTICYAFMQAIGMVNDHLTDCFRHEQVASSRG